MVNQTFATPQEALAHYGVKGMKWGVRKDDAAGGGRPSSSATATVARLDATAEAYSDRILEQSGLADQTSSNRDRNRKILIAAGVSVGIATVVAGAYIYSQQDRGQGQAAPGADKADQFTLDFEKRLQDQLTKKLPPLDSLDDRDLTLPSSTTFRRISGSADEPISDSHMYASHLDEDADRYVGVFSKVVKNRAGDAYLSEMSLNTSVSSPSLKKRVDIMKSMLDDVDRDPKSLTEGMSFREVLVESSAAVRHKAQGGSLEAHEKRLASLSDDDLVRETYGVFVNTMGGQINNPQYRVSHPSQYLEKVRSMGYNALVDDANVGVLARSPILLLTPQTTIKSRTATRISDTAIAEARAKLDPIAQVEALIRHAWVRNAILRGAEMVKMENENQTFATPQEALAHYGVKGMKWGVRKDDKTSGGNVGSNEDLAPLLVVTAIFAGITAIKARYEYVDSGKRDAKRIEKTERKTGVKQEWKRKESLTGPKTVDEIKSDVIPDINPGFPNVAGTSMNCRRCTFTYEMRRRGYDVKATKSMMATGQDMTGVINATSPGATNKSIRSEVRNTGIWGRNPIPTTVNRRDMTPEGKSQSIFDALGRQPDGSRGELAFSWPFGGGHSVAYEVVGGKAVVFDTQTRKTFTSPDSFAKDYGQMVNEAAFTRLDNADLNQDFLRRWVTDA